MQEELHILKDCVLRNLDAADKDEIICALSSCLKRKEFVCDDYEKAVLEREEKYPTGLKIGRYNIAIPHTEPQYVNVPAIAIATLNSRVPFHRMDSCEESVDVDVVLLLALNQGHTHMEVLSRIIAMCQDEHVIDALVASEDEETIVEIVKNRLSGGEHHE